MTRLRAQGISLQFGEKPTLDDVSFDLEVGEFATLIGPNGSGKSTLLKVVAGILSLQGRGASGQVRLGERDFLALDPRARARAVAYVGAELRADFPLTAMETVSLGRICHGAGSLSPLSSLDEELDATWADIGTDAWKCSIGVRTDDTGTFAVNLVETSQTPTGATFRISQKPASGKKVIADIEVYV